MTTSEFRAARASFGLTQKAWGFALGIGREHVAKLEAGAPISRTVALLVTMYLVHGIPKHHMP